MPDEVALAAAAFVAMEPVTYVLHRFVMHGPGMRWHASHHGRRTGTFEANDRYPVVLASTTVGMMALGAAVEPLRPLLAVGAGVTLYGAAYLFVHDLYAHRRLGLVRFRLPGLERLARDHALHHRFGGEPYGMLLPFVPGSVRRRARTGAARPTAHTTTTAARP